MPRLLTDDAAKEKMQQIQDRLNTDPTRNVPVVTPKATSATEELLNKDAISSVEDAAWVSTFQAGMDMGDATTKEQPSAAAAAADIQKDVIDLKAGDSGLQESVQKDSGLCCGGRLCSVQLVFNRNSRAWLTHVFFCSMCYSSRSVCFNHLSYTLPLSAIAGKGDSDGIEEGWNSGYRVASH